MPLLTKEHQNRFHSINQKDTGTEEELQKMGYCMGSQNKFVRLNQEAKKRCSDVVYTRTFVDTEGRIAQSLSQQGCWLEDWENSTPFWAISILARLSGQHRGQASHLANGCRGLHRDDHATPFSVRLKTLPRIFTAWCLIKHRYLCWLVLYVEMTMHNTTLFTSLRTSKIRSPIQFLHIYVLT
jgi:hypothetical protein